MAGFQAVRIPSSYPATQQTSHHFHPHHLHQHLHQHQQPHRSSPSSTDCLAPSSPCASNSASASEPAPSSSAQLRSFSAVGSPSGDLHQQTTLASSSTRRRHSEDSSTSSRLRSEWVTLSKAMLMVLVEKICQLSFENDTQTTTMSGAESATLRPLASNEATSQAFAGATDERSKARSGSVATSVVAGLPCLVGPAIALSVAPSVDTNDAAAAASPAAAHSYSSHLVPAPAPHPDDDSIRAAAAAAAIDASTKTDAENTLASAAAVAAHDLCFTMIPTDAATEPSASWKSAIGSLNRKRGSRRPYTKPARGGGRRGRGARKTEDADVVERMEDKMRAIKMRPLRQRNSDRNVQPWVACNKDLVYSMIDSALGATDPATQTGARKVVEPSQVAFQKGVRSAARRRSTLVAEDVRTRTSSTVDPRGHTEGPRRPVGSPDAPCEAPLLGALLSYDDAGITTKARDIPIFPPPPLCRQLHHPRRSSPMKANRLTASTWHRTSSEELQISNQPCQNLIRGGSVHRGNQAFAASTCSSAEVRDAENPASTRSAAKNSLRTTTGFSGKSSMSAPQTRSGSNRLQHSTGLLSELDLGKPESRQTKTGAKTTIGPDVERPRWIALDKDEVRLLVDSLVSTMMTPDDDVTHDSAARCRSVAPHSNVTCNNSYNYRNISDNNFSRPGNVETGCQQLIVTDTDSGRHDNREDNRRLIATNSGRCDDDETTIEYGRILDMDLSRHGNGHFDDGKRGCWRRRAMQCLSTDDAHGLRDFTLERGSVARDNAGECSAVARGVSEGLARSTMKWKSNMLLRLHSQSQDEEKEHWT